MTKFASFLVFALGLMLIGATIFMFVKKVNTPPRSMRANQELQLPACDLPPLELGTRDKFMEMLDSMSVTGGLGAVQKYVDKEFVPGRLITGGQSPGGGVRAHRLIDREIRQTDREGGALLDRPPVLARSSPMMRASDESQIESWPRLNSHPAYALTVWWIDVGRVAPEPH
jgi:hypothetical protein